jgi:hypothetical protein
MMIDILKKRVNAVSIEPNIHSNVTTVTIHLMPIESRDKENLTCQTQQSTKSTKTLIQVKMSKTHTQRKKKREKEKE